MLEKYTFGNSPCAQNLVAILNDLNEPKINASVSRFLAENNEMINQVMVNIKDKRIKRSLLALMHKSIQNTSIHVPSKVKTHAINILIGKIRDTLQMIDKRK